MSNLANSHIYMEGGMGADPGIPEDTPAPPTNTGTGDKKGDTVGASGAISILVPPADLRGGTEPNDADKHSIVSFSVSKPTARSLLQQQSLADKGTYPGGGNTMDSDADGGMDADELSEKVRSPTFSSDSIEDDPIVMNRLTSAFCSLSPPPHTLYIHAPNLPFPSPSLTISYCNYRP